MSKDSSEKATFFQTLQDISQSIESGKALMPDEYITEFQTYANEICSQLESIMQTSRTLKLGIVGEVKAGKSSFLNAMLFNGDDILPKAPTPMTAALTKLSYSETPEARVYFYNRTDWDSICLNAKRYDEMLDNDYRKYCSEYEERLARKKERDRSTSRRNNPPFLSSASPTSLKPKKTKAEFEREKRKSYPAEIRACKEVYDMAEGLDVDRFLSDDPIVISSSDSSKSYMSQIQQYVGAGGKYTPIVKYTEIQLNNPLLKGIEVVDTPGLNDPILSRSRTTSKFLMQCDTVFMLSYSGQFLGAEDIGFITSILPSEGINHAVIIGSKFDSGILDYPGRGVSFRKAKDASIANYRQQAKTNLSDFCKTSGRRTALLDVLLSSEIQFVASLMYSAAKHIENNQDLSVEENHMIEQMKKRFPDFKTDADSLYALANIDTVRDTSFKTVKATKEKILAERNQTLIQSQIGRFLGLLENILIQANNNLSEVKETDIDSLEERLAMMTQNLTSVRSQVKSLFDSAVSTVLSSRNGIMIEVSKELSNYTDIIVNSSNTTKRTPNRVTKGHLFWKRTETVGYDTEIITHHTANISDLQKNINEFNNRAMEIINNRFNSILNISDLRERIKGAVIGAFDIGDRSFDENAILMPLESALRKITIPYLDFNVEKYYSLIDKKLSGVVSSGTVKDEKISLLLVAQQEILDQMRIDYTESISMQCEVLESNLQQQASVFIDDIVTQLEENSDKIKQLLHDKKTSMSLFDSFISEIELAKKKLRKLE